MSLVDYLRHSWTKCALEGALPLLTMSLEHNMYIERLVLENVRGLKQVDLDFSRPDGSFKGWTVIAGKNGAGKTTLLRALAQAVTGPWAARTLNGDTFVGWIRGDAPMARVEAKILPHPEDAFRGKGRRSKGGFWAGLEWQAQEDGPEPSLVEYAGSNPDGAKQSPERGPWADNPEGWFLAGYGPFRRLSGHSPGAQRDMVGPARVRRVVTLFREDASLVESIRWLQHVYLRSFEGKTGAKKTLDTVLELLRSGLLPSDLEVKEVDSEGLWVTQFGTRLPLDQLSDGCRAMTGLVVDLVRLLHESFGSLKTEPKEDSLGSYVAVTHKAVVLIDELDVHLHVSWQQKAGFWFKRHFPNVQFLVATHSPFVCQAADPKGLIVLRSSEESSEDSQAQHVSERLYWTVVNGGADDAVCSELFGLEDVHSPAAAKLREKVAELEQHVALGAASAQQLELLASLRGMLPSEPSADVAKALEHLVEDLGRQVKVRTIVRRDLSLAATKFLADRTETVAQHRDPRAEAKRLWGNKNNAAFREVKQLLREMASGLERCMYCEDSAGTDIEHFYPKATFPHKAYQWSNYLLACSHCNSNEKREQFPLGPNNAPLQIDPTSQDPREHISFSGSTGSYLPRTPQGQESIRVFGLERHALVKGRKDRWLILQQLIAGYGALRAVGKDQAAQALKEAICRAPFSGVLVYLVCLPASARPALLTSECVSALAAYPEIAGWPST